jgi:hypothetical protein
MLPLDPSELYADLKRPTQIEEDPRRLRRSPLELDTTRHEISDRTYESQRHRASGLNLLSQRFSY